MRNYYSNKYFFNDNSIWRSIKSNEDVEFHYKRLSNMINYYEKFSGGELDRENTEDLYKELGKIEIALRKIEQFNNSSYSNIKYIDEDISKLMEKYELLSEKVSNIDMRRVCWD